MRIYINSRNRTQSYAIERFSVGLSVCTGETNRTSRGSPREYRQFHVLKRLGGSLGRRRCQTILSVERSYTTDRHTPGMRRADRRCSGNEGTGGDRFSWRTSRCRRDGSWKPPPVRLPRANGEREVHRICPSRAERDVRNPTQRISGQLWADWRTIIEPRMSEHDRGCCFYTCSLSLRQGWLHQPGTILRYLPSQPHRRQ